MSSGSSGVRMTEPPPNPSVAMVASSRNSNVTVSRYNGYAAPLLVNQAYNVTEPGNAGRVMGMDVGGELVDVHPVSGGASVCVTTYWSYPSGTGNRTTATGVV